MVTRFKEPVIPITEIEHSAFCRTEDELKSRSLAEEFKVNVRWQRIPVEYLHLSAEELDARIGEARRALGEKVTILGHHYQREEVIRYADYQGDSYKLSQRAGLPSRVRLHRLLRSPLYGGDGVYPLRPPPEGDPAQHHSRMLHGRYGPHGRRAGRLGRPGGGSGRATAGSCPWPT